MALFPSFHMDHLDERLSNHLPFLLHTCWSDRCERQRRRRKRFEIMWVVDDKCEDIANGAWEGMGGGDVVAYYVLKVDRCMLALLKWNAEEFDNVHKQIQMA